MHIKDYMYILTSLLLVTPASGVRVSSLTITGLPACREKPAECVRECGGACGCGVARPTTGADPVFRAAAPRPAPCITK